MKQHDLWNGQQYKQHSSPQERSAQNLIESICFDQTDTILDVGCGDGKITQKLCLFAPDGQTYGLDPSKSMIEEAKKSSSHLQNIHFMEGNAEDFTLDPAFDYIFSFHSLHWVKNKEKMFKNISDHLKDGGKFIFVTAGAENPQISRVFSSPKWRKKMEHHGKKFHALSNEDIEQTLGDSKLSIESTQLESWSSFYDRPEDLINWLMTWVPYATGFNSEDSLSFSQEICANLTAQSIQDGVVEKIELKTELLVVVLSKSKFF